MSLNDLDASSVLRERECGSRWRSTNTTSNGGVTLGDAGYDDLTLMILPVVGS